MLAATVLIPTYRHPLTLPIAVRSVLAQTLPDFELFIVGDGVEDDTRVAVARLQADDDRIRFFDLPKGPRRGELHRHAALQEAKGRVVAYVGDDDLWMPDHLATLDAALRKADFAHTMHIGINEKGALSGRPADLQDPAYRARALKRMLGFSDICAVGHTLEAYRRLPHGWRTTPEDFAWSDLFMWRQFLAEPWCVARSVMIPTTICSQTHLRPELSDAARAEELAGLLDRCADADFREQLWRGIAQEFARQAVRERGAKARKYANSEGSGAL